MPKYLQIQIPKPCHENWDKMNVAQQGKYCNSCQKNVIDFSLMSDDDLVRFFKKNKENVCGRFNQDQLGNDIPLPVKKIPWLRYFFQISIPAFLFSAKVNGQCNRIGKVRLVETGKIINKDVIKIDTSKLIHGQVINEKGNPIPYASVRIKNSKLGMAADSTGRFEIRMPGSYSTLILSSIGFYPKEIVVDLMKDDQLEIKLETFRNIELFTVGEISYRVIKKKKKFISIPLLTKRTNSFTIFPNPVTVNSELTIKWKEPVTSDQVAEIYDQKGRLIQKEIISINNKLDQQSIKINQLIPGTYILKISDNKTHRSLSRQFIVQ